VKEQTPPIAASGARRRSTRVVQSIPVVVTWSQNGSKTVLEETATLSINCHGCQYFSRFPVKKKTRIDVQVGAAGDSTPQHFPARVAWIRKSRRLGGMYQVGVEFEIPRNVWQIGQAPEDWIPFSPAGSNPVSPSLLTEVERLLGFADAGDFYKLLGVSEDAAPSVVKRQFYHLASRFHPDHHMDHPEWTPRLVILMESLTTAYKTLSGEESKRQRDSRENGPIQQDPSELQRMAQECMEKSRECLAVKNYAASILWLRRAIEADPTSSQVRTMLGHSLAAIPEYRHEAVEQFEKALELDPTFIAAHFQYAQMLEQMKMPGRARLLYARVLELDMNHREARERLNRIDSASPRVAARASLLGRLTGRR